MCMYEGVHESMCTDMCNPEVDLRCCFSGAAYLVLFETVFLTWPETHQ